MQNLSQAQINMDDTPIGVLPYPSTRSGRHSALAAPAVAPVPETDCLWNLRFAFSPGDTFCASGKITQKRELSPAASSDIEIISSTFPRVPVSDKKPVRNSSPLRIPYACSKARISARVLLRRMPSRSILPFPYLRPKNHLIEIDNDPTKGNTAILQTADAMKQVKILAFITAHDTWAKNQDRLIKNDVDVTSFFQSVVGAPCKTAGFVIMMENPARSAQEANDVHLLELTKNQAQLRAQNTLNNVGTTASDLAHATPVDPQSRWLTVLQEHHGSLKNNKAEGWQLGTKDVTIDDPPTELEEFFWIDVKPVKRLPLTATPSVVKRLKVEEDCRPSEFEFGSYVEMQSSTVRVDFKTLRHIKVHSTLQQYLTWCEIDYLKIDDYVQIFFKHSITSFHRFLFPSMLSAQTIASWGIPYGVVMELMT
ncbi:uncharacterized protein MELLADRAFT_87180 [Melampsora larici-populina 98AG31]|uniref:Uncharacterized protein n=1 Tax=Melampsora larici-populina (strain 98AG31 / pathotype 3-4-7) TaxID=747676 RepID=F4R4T5_MELLP|nr:uncharacterized protein MELLADRAFT_87180 [Melampsora larici-populina 98AG31]EGG12944.1 hypothetical protein MELLADRAFT_87180 [Melampsora larici-populina 98AG31]